jgi:N-acetylneuraminate synthase
MVIASRRLEAALGTGVKVVEANEAQTVVVQRRAIRLRADLSAGHRLTDADLEMLRPCPPDAIDPRWLDQLVGKDLRVGKRAGDTLAWSDVV